MTGFVAYLCAGMAEAFAAVRAQAVQAAKRGRRTTARCFGSLILGSGACWTCSGGRERRLVARSPRLRASARAQWLHYALTGLLAGF